MGNKEISKKDQGNFYRVIYYSTCFMLFLTYITSVGNMMNQIYERLGYQNLTQICMIAGCSCCVIGSFAASYTYSRVPRKVLLLLGAVGSALSISSGAIVTYCDKYKVDSFYCEPRFIYPNAIILSIIAGFINPFFWICFGPYINKCCNKETRGFLNGLSSSILQSSQLWGSLISTLVLGYMDEFSFFILNMGVAVLVIIMLMFVPEPLEYKENEEHQEDNSKESLWKLIKSFTTETLLNKKYTFLLLAMIFSGIVLGFFPNYLGTSISYTVPALPTNLAQQRVAFIFLMLSIGEIAGGITIGNLSEKFDNIKLLNITLVLGQIALMITLLSNYFVSYNIAMLGGILWGFCDNASQTTMNIIIGSKFNSRPELFAAYGMFQNLGMLLISGVTLLFSKLSPIAFLPIIGIMIVLVQWLMIESLPKNVKVKGASEISYENLELKYI